MKKFITKLLVFSIFVVCIIMLLLWRYSGYVNEFYGKFTSPKQYSLILGDSRSFQGIQPSVINKRLDNDFQTPIYNYSFTIEQVSYGEPFLESIKKKIDPDTKNGLFILSVHPWVLAKREKDDFENNVFFEDEFLPNNMHFTSMNPNPEFFFRNFETFHFKSVFRKLSQVHEDGWMEDSNMTTDTAVQNSWKKKWLASYNKFNNKWETSDYRLAKLNKTIEFLKNHGTVVLVRMPLDKTIVAVEEKFWKDFDSDITTIAKANGIRYFNYARSNSPFVNYDGVHLNKEQGALFTNALCDSIKKYKD